MVKCRDCKSEMVFRFISKTEIILVCPNTNCDFKSQPIQLDQSHTPHDQENDIDIDQLELEIKSEHSLTINDSDSKIEQIDSVQESEVISESLGSQTLLMRDGELDEFIIYCVDFSMRMDKEISVDETLVNGWREKILKDTLLSDILKNELVELINPPISFFDATLFSLSYYLLENIKKMTYENFNTFQVISLAGKSDEIFRFPSFIDDTTPDIILDFIKRMKITRKEYIANGVLTFRDYSLAIQNISELITELRESFPKKDIKIFFLAIGYNQTKDNKYINPIREIKGKLEHLMPFTFNIINLNGTALENYFGQITRRFSGQYSRENTFKGLINSILYQQYGTDPHQERTKIHDLNLEASTEKESIIEKKLPPNIIELTESQEDKKMMPKIYVKDSKIKDRTIINQRKDIKKVYEKPPEIIIKRKADNELEQLIKKIR